MNKKICTKCRKEKKASFFYKEKTLKSGLRSRCKICCLKDNNEYYKGNKEKVMQYSKKWGQKNVLKRRQAREKWKKKNPDKDLECKRNYKKRNSKNLRERYKSDISYRLPILLRNRLRDAIREEHKSGLAIDYLGCAMLELKQHLENQFQEGMSWKNWGKTGWHIDHIIPLSSFDLTDENQIKKACHYTNLQPLWEKENLKKGAKVSPLAIHRD